MPGRKLWWLTITLQGQKYTNGAGAVPELMMGSASDICCLQMARCTLSSVSSWSVRETLGVPVNSPAIVWKEHSCHGSHSPPLHRKWQQRARQHIFRNMLPAHYAGMICCKGFGLYIFILSINENKWHIQICPSLLFPVLVVETVSAAQDHKGRQDMQMRLEETASKKVPRTC